MDQIDVYVPDCIIIEDLDDFVKFILSTPANCKSNFVIIHLNIRSLRSNFDNFISLISNYSHMLSVIILSEIWIYNDEISFYSIDNFDSFFCCRNFNRSGGIVVFARKDFYFTEIDINLVSSESILLHSNTFDITILSVYRSHSFTIDFFNNEFKTLLSTLNQSNIVIMGDLNIDILKEDDNDITEYLNCLSLYGFQSFINYPTRVNNISSTCIDHLFVRSSLSNIVSGIYMSDISDHYLTLCKLNIPSKTHNVPALNSKFINHKKLFDYLITYNFKWNNRDSLDQQYNTLVFSLFNMRNNFKFSVNPKQNKKRKQCWMNETILTLICRKEKLYKKVRKNPFDIIYRLAYKTTVSELKRIIKITKSEFYKLKFLNCNTSKQKWNLVNDICQINKPSDLPQLFSDLDTASKFIDQFTILTPKTHSILTFSKIYISPSLSSFVLDPFYDLEIISVLNSFSKVDSVDSDGLSIKILKAFAINNISFLTNFINQSITLSNFPSSLKKATISPVFKAGDKNIFSNYRPISILPTFAKVIEKALSTRMYNFLNNSSFFADNQYGFIKGRNTEQALLSFSKFIYDSIDNNRKTAAVFLDISKAFDTVNHSILTIKLENAGFRGPILQWFISYLSNRMQRVKIRNTFSDYLLSNCGVPQGSILGPLLFIVFINDFCKLKLFGKIITYADDSVLLYSCLNTNELKSQIESDLIAVRKWFSFNDLTLNLTKTKLIHFDLIQTNNDLNIKFHSTSCNGFIINCDCHLLQQVNSIKYLGIFIDSNLKWKTHIKELNKKLRFVLIKFHHLKNKIHKSFLLTLYHSWFYSLINYGIIIWGGEYRTNLVPLISIQKKMFKLLSSPLSPDFRNLNILPIRHIAFFRIILFLFRNKNFCILKNNISSRRPTEIYQIPHFRKEVFRKHFFYLAPKLYNNLPLELQVIPNLSTFKRLLFKFLIEIDNVDVFFSIS